MKWRRRDDIDWSLISRIHANDLPKAADIIKADNLPASNHRPYQSLQPYPQIPPYDLSPQVLRLCPGISPQGCIQACLPVRRQSTRPSVSAKATTRILSLKSVVPSTSTSALVSAQSTASEASTAAINTLQLTPSPITTKDSLSKTLADSETVISQSDADSSTSTSTTPASEPISLLGAITILSLAALSPLEIVIVITKTLPSILPALLSSLDTTRKSETLPTSEDLTPQAKSHSHSRAPSPSPSLPAHEQWSTSVVGVLTSAGLPYPVAASLVPVIIRDPPEAGAGASASPQTTEMEQ